MLPTHRPPTHPGEMLLKEFLEPLGVSQVEEAERMGVPFQRLNSIVKGRRAVSADTALLLHALTGWNAQLWLTFKPSGISGTLCGLDGPATHGPAKAGHYDAGPAEAGHYGARSG